MCWQADFASEASPAGHRQGRSKRRLGLARCGQGDRSMPKCSMSAGRIFAVGEGQVRPKVVRLPIQSTLVANQRCLHGRSVSPCAAISGALQCSR